ncbi:MAG: hypothetical protein AAFN93_05850 [Bacteroidota bacterium]
MNKIVFTALYTLALFYNAHGQQNFDIYQRIDALVDNQTLPKRLMETKTVVLVSVTPKSQNPTVRGDWKEMTKQAQPGFVKAGIDAVVYYYLDDIISGKESYEAFLDQFDERNLKNAIFLFRENGKYKIKVTDLQDRQYLLKMGQDAWVAEDTDLDRVLDLLYKATANSGMEWKNRLVLEVPEFGKMIKIIDGRRGEFYDLNFSSEKLAIPTFADTAEIRRVMASYPYKYDIVDPSLTEREIRKKGYQYILYYVNASGIAVKEILEYNTTDTETDYITEVIEGGNAQVKSLNIQSPVFKFYVKHIYSSNIFLGKRWDADSTWQLALENYIANLKNELVRN